MSGMKSETMSEKLLVGKTGFQWARPMEKMTENTKVPPMALMLAELLGKWMGVVLVVQLVVRKVDKMEKHSDKHWGCSTAMKKAASTERRMAESLESSRGKRWESRTGMRSVVQWVARKECSRERRKVKKSVDSLAVK
jgi:hypothetical protein